jgi:DNA helicase-2/ATP-dependent DNA helicase PcrA
MLASRIANILASTDTKPENILCLTFTEAGVVAMRQKLHNMIGETAYYVKVTTFHSFANEVIQLTRINLLLAELTQLDDLSSLSTKRDNHEK